MSLLNVSKQEVTNALVNKLDLQFRSGKERNAWFELDGRKILRVTIPKGRGALPPGTADAIRNQVKLSVEEYGRLIRCPLKGRGYREIIRGKTDRGIL